MEGKALRRLNLLDTVEKQLLPSLSQSPEPEESLPQSAVQALAELSVQLRAHLDGKGGSELTPDMAEKLRKLLRSQETAPAALGLLRALRYDGSAQPITPETARALYGGETLSVSRLEQFAGCPFQHFLNYGLRPQVLREWKVDPIETGNFYHAALDGFSRLARREKGYPAVSPERVRQMTEEAMELLKVFGLEAEADTLADNLPYGKQRKLEIARALATKPKLLLLDEPAAGMNPNETQELMDTIRFVREHFDMTILLIEHDMKLVSGICEELTVLNFGRVLCQGKTSDVLNNPEVIKAYLGE